MKNGFQKLLCFTAILFSAQTFAIPIGGIEFPEGNISFADAIVFYGDPSTCVGTIDYTNPPTCSLPADVGSNYNDPAQALGLPDWVLLASGAANSPGSVSLGDGGQLVVRFLNNALTTSGNSDDDLFIFEIGSAVEDFFVDISLDGITWIELGVIDGQPSGLDIDGVTGVVAGALYTWVRLRDDQQLNQTDSPFGEADIDAIGAISTVFVPPVQASEPSMLAIILAGFGMLVMRKFKIAK